MKIDLAGKIFVVLIFLMSLVFASFAIMHYTSHRNWRDEILRKPAEVRGNQEPGLKYRLEQAYLENDRLKKARAVRKTTRYRDQSEAASTGQGRSHD